MTTNDHHSEIAARFASLRERIAAGTITRGTWSDRDSAGRERVCLLLALAAEVRGTDDHHEPSRCPAWLLPPWLAELTPWIDDESSDAAWPAMLVRYADVVGRAVLVLDAVAWRRCEFVTRRAVVLVAREATNDESAIAACDRVVALCDRVIAGDEPTAGEWTAARAAAAWAAGAAAWAATRTAAWAATWAEADAAARAAEAAARAADWAAWAAGAAARAARAAAWTAAWAATWAATWAEADAAARAAEAAAGTADRIIDACLTAIEREIDQAVGGGA